MSVLNYFQESYEELKKVTWPTRNQAMRLTFIVLGFCFSAALLMGVLDFGFNYGYRSLVLYAEKIVPRKVEAPPVKVDNVQTSVEKPTDTQEAAKTPSPKPESTKKPSETRK